MTVDRKARTLALSAKRANASGTVDWTDFAGFTQSDTPDPRDKIVGYAQSGGTGSERRWNLRDIRQRVKWAFNSSGQENSLAHLPATEVNVGDRWYVDAFSSDNQIGSNAVWEVWQKGGGTTVPGTIVNGGASLGVTMEGTGGVKWKLLPDTGNMIDIRAAGIKCDGVLNNQHSLFATIAAAAQASGQIMTGGGVFRIAETLDLRSVDFDFRQMLIQAGTPVNSSTSGGQVGDFYTGGDGGSQTNIYAVDYKDWSGTVRTVGAAVRVAGPVGVNAGRDQNLFVRGDGNFDFTTRSTVAGVVFDGDNGPHGTTIAHTTYCCIGGVIQGQLEKTERILKATYCDYLVMNGNIRLGSGSAASSADTLIMKVFATVYRHGIWECDGADSSVHYMVDIESRTDPLDGSPNHWIASGKFTELSGRERAVNGDLGIYVDKTSNNGTDTFVCNLVRVHGYGSPHLWVRRCTQLAGTFIMKDVDDAPSLAGTNPGPAIRIDQVGFAGGFTAIGLKLKNAVGVQFGDGATGGLYSRDTHLGTYCLDMLSTGSSAYPFNNDNSEKTVASSFPTDTVAVSLQRGKAVVARVIGKGAIIVGAGAVANDLGIRCRLEVPAYQLARYALTIDPAAACDVGSGLLVGSDGKVPQSALPGVAADPTFLESVQDAVAAMIVAGSGIVANYDDAAGTLTLQATGGGGSGSFDGTFAVEYSNTTPAAPASGVTLFARKRAGRVRIAARSPAGRPASAQPLLGGNKVRLWTANGNSTTVTTSGLASSTTGTATTRNVAATNDFTMFSRIGYVAASAAVNQGFGVRHGALQFARSNNGTKKACGFEYIARWGLAVADGNLGRLAIGMFGTASALSASVAMTTLTDCVFIGKDDGDANLSIYCNDGTGTAVKTSLGASFPGNTGSADMYETRIGCLPDGTTIFWSIENLVTGAFTEGGFTTDIPAATTLLSPQIFGSTGTSTVQMGIDIVSQYVETDF